MLDSEFGMRILKDPEVLKSGVIQQIQQSLFVRVACAFFEVMKQIWKSTVDDGQRGVTFARSAVGQTDVMALAFSMDWFKGKS